MGDEVTIFEERAPVALDRLAALARPLLERAGAVRAVAFGSYARGEADAWSDLDLVVVAPTDLPFVERWQVLEDLVRHLPVPVDLLVYTPAEFEALSAEGRGIFARLAQEGVLIYDRSGRGGALAQGR